MRFCKLNTPRLLSRWNWNWNLSVFSLERLWKNFFAGHFPLNYPTVCCLGNASRSRWTLVVKFFIEMCVGINLPWSSINCEKKDKVIRKTTWQVLSCQKTSIQTEAAANKQQGKEDQFGFLLHRQSFRGIKYTYYKHFIQRQATIYKYNIFFFGSGVLAKFSAGLWAPIVRQMVFCVPSFTRHKHFQCFPFPGCFQGL